MLKIGITGGIGSGKSTVAKIFEVLEIPVFYADQEAKSLMHTDELLINGIKEAFGNEAYADKQLNRRYIADIVFNNEQELTKLNSLVHPAVFRAFDAWVIDQQAPYVLKEAALLFESGSSKLCDQTILVTAPEKLKIQRVMHRDSITEDHVRTRISKQLTEEQALKLADHIIINDEQHLLIHQVLQLHEQFLSLARLNDHS
ncbi:MAG TPA: dephospho-CoA kinase [Sphingobacteriaceae bacterium]|nr:dephospho-CoA kinase [Sphingobacteriaceae bacterium]